MNTNLRMRHNIVKLMRRHLEDVHDFIEVFLVVPKPKFNQCIKQ
jgi:hypothetical protein